MIVFKGFLKLVRRNFSVVVLYPSIFLIICILIQIFSGGEGMADFEEESLDIAVIDRDESLLSEALVQYLGQHHRLVDVPDNPDVIQEELFYRNIYYVVTIPPDFEEKCLEQGEKLPTTKIPGAYSAYYVDQQINSFLNDVRILKAAGHSSEEICEKAVEIQDIQTEVTLLDKNGHGGAWAPHAYMFQYMPYMILSTICYMIGYIMIGFREKNVRLRMNCGAMPPRQQNAQLILGYLFLGGFIWILCVLLPVFMYQKEFLKDGNMLLYMLNIFVAIVVSLAISFTMSTLVRKADIISAVVNVISLGMSFTCGVFVPMDVLGKGVKTFAQFLPFYWYEIVNQLLAENVDFTRSQQFKICQGLGIQALFAAAIVCAGMIIDRRRTA